MLHNLHIFYILPLDTSSLHIHIHRILARGDRRKVAPSPACVRFLAQFPVETEGSAMAFAYVSGMITKGRNPLCGPSSPTEKNKYPRRAAGPCRVQLVKRIVFRDVPGYWLSRGRYIFGRAQIVLLYGRPIARGGSIPAYLTYKGINIEWQVHSGQSRHTWFGHGLFSTHAKLAPLGAHPVHSLSLSFMDLLRAAPVLVPRLSLLAHPYPCRTPSYILRPNLIP